MNYNYSPEEIADALMDITKDMDFADYEEHEEETRSELTEALQWLLNTCQNELNSDYFRTLYTALDDMAHIHRTDVYGL